jgi:D-alanyl-D-alanine carboxypeptidase
MAKPSDCAVALDPQRGRKHNRAGLAAHCVAAVPNAFAANKNHRLMHSSRNVRRSRVGMIRRFAPVALVASVLGIVLGVSTPSMGQSTATARMASSQPAYAATLHAEIARVMKANVIPGAIVLIKSRDKGDWRATLGTGTIGKSVPLTLADYVRIGSNTKTMTSTVIMQLVQEGKLRLDDPIAKFRPDVPNGQNITIEQLATMRSGLYSYTFDRGFNETLDKDPQKAWTPDELLKIAFWHPPNGPPGQKFDYCNTNIVLLGLVIEQLTGMSARDAFRQRIFEPLKLTHTQLPAANDSSLPRPHPQGYQFLSNVATIDSYAVPPAQLPAALSGTLKPINQTNANPSWAWTAGGAISTADDLAVYVKALVGRWLAQSGDAENPSRQHRADQPRQPERRRIRDRHRAFRPVVHRARWTDSRLLDRDGLRPKGPTTRSSSSRTWRRCPPLARVRHSRF